VVAVATEHLDGAAVRAYLAGAYRDDLLRARARASGAAASSTLLGRRDAREHAAAIGCRDAVCCYIVVVPLVGATRMLGTLRVADERPLTDDAGEQLMVLAAAASVRLAQLGFGGSINGGARLTRRQRDVAQLVSRGFTNAAIARELQVSEDAIKKHVRTMMDALDVANRAELAVYASRALAGPDELDGEQVAPGFHVYRSPAADEGG
jgi:DNA-binding CsgD family transcriptional regulator